tara:strand:+ start:2835 stop:3701 length:867 start_codon:yes stop_codon:yes gene_type:complete
MSSTQDILRSIKEYIDQLKQIEEESENSSSEELNLRIAIIASLDDQLSEAAIIASSIIKYDPFTIPNNGEGFLKDGEKHTYMCFWISLADGLNHINYQGRQDWSWYELKEMIDNITNDSGELFDIGYSGKHMDAFEEIAQKLQIKIIVYPLQEDIQDKRNSISETISISSRNTSDIIIKILNFRNHYEFIAGFGNDGGSGVAKKLAFIDQTEEAINAVIIALKHLGIIDRQRTLDGVINSINLSELDSKQKTFMINDINRQVLDWKIDMKKKYLKYKKKYFKLKKSLA